MKKISILFLLFAVYFTGNPIQSQVVPNKFRVWVAVACDDHITKAQIESYIKRELRSFEDVIVSEGHTGYTLYLTVLEPKYTSTGLKTGNIIISCVYVERFSLLEILSYYLPLAYETKGEEIAKKIWRLDAPPLFYSHFIDNYVQFSQTDKLPDICKKIVANFDTDALEKERKKR